MQTLDIREIAQGLHDAARYYIVDAFKDRTFGFIRKEFDAQLAMRGMEDCIELRPEAAGFFLEKNLTESMLFNDKRNKLMRQVSVQYISDVDDLAVSPGVFVAQLGEAIRQYVVSLPMGTTHVSVPVLYLDVKAYKVEWLIWGYYGIHYKEKA